MSVSAPTYIYPPIQQDPTALYNGFVSYMQAWIPGWKAYSGELDDWLGRVFTGIAAQLMEISADVATSIYRYFGAFIVNLPPYAAIPATGTMTITVQDSAGYTIPAFTQMTFADASGNQQGFETTSAVTIASGATTATGVLVQAMTPGSAGNGCTGAGSLSGSTPLTFITGLTLTTTTSQGADEETDSAYLSRLTNLFTTLSPSPITPVDFTVIAGTQAGVGRATTIGGFNPANWTTTGNTHTTTTIDGIASTANIPVGASISGSGIPAGAFVRSITSSSAIVISAATTTTLTGTTLTIGGALNQGGYVTSWVVDANGNALTSPAMGTIQTTIQNECLIGVSYGVLAPTSTAMNITAVLTAYSGQSTSSVQSAVSAALTSYFQPLNYGTINSAVPSNGVTSAGWVADAIVRWTQVLAVVMKVPGVHAVSSLQLNGGTTFTDLALSGVVPLTTAGTMTITVTTG